MKKIMFNDKYGLTKAVLEGRKTMTRRTVNKITIDRANDYVQKVYGSGHDMLDYFLEHSLYKVGEVVAVAQKYKDVIYTGGLPHPIVAKPGWNNKMFVRADLMPHKIQITGCHVERMQDISDEDCLREGIRKMTFDTFSFDSWKFFVHNPREAFAALINKISGKGTWESNPMVYVYEFELVTF